MLTAKITATHTTGNKDAPYVWEMWLNADTKEQARELGAQFPEYVETYTKGSYRRLYARFYFADADAPSILQKVVALREACDNNDVDTEYVVRNPETHYTEDEFFAHVFWN